MFFRWLKNLRGTGMSKSTQDDGVLDLGDKIEPLGIGAFTRGGGGGECPGCGNLSNVLYDDGKCARCTTSGDVSSDRPCDRDTCGTRNRK